MINFSQPILLLYYALCIEPAVCPIEFCIVDDIKIITMDLLEVPLENKSQSIVGFFLLQHTILLTNFEVKYLQQLIQILFCSSFKV